VSLQLSVKWLLVVLFLLILKFIDFNLMGNFGGCVMYKEILPFSACRVGVLSCSIGSLNSSRCFQVFVDEGLWGHSIHLIATSLSEFTSLLPPDTKPEFPSRICLLGNILEVAVYGLSRSDCTIQMVRFLI